MTRNVDAKIRGDPAWKRFRIEDSPFYLIARTSGRYAHDMEAVLKTIGMDVPRWRTLMIVHQYSPSSVSEIADRAVIRLSTMTKVVQRLAREGFVRLAARKSDARRTDVYLTPRGEDAVEQVRSVASRIYQLAFRDFRPAEIAAFNDMLRRVHANLALTPEAPGSPRRRPAPRRRRA